MAGENDENSLGNLPLVCFYSIIYYITESPEK
jgi:hypothetical protein